MPQWACNVQSGMSGSFKLFPLAVYVCVSMFVYVLTYASWHTDSAFPRLTFTLGAPASQGILGCIRYGSRLTENLAESSVDLMIMG